MIGPVICYSPRICYKTAHVIVMNTSLVIVMGTLCPWGGCGTINCSEFCPLTYAVLKANHFVKVQMADSESACNLKIVMLHTQSW